MLLVRLVLHFLFRMVKLKVIGIRKDIFEPVAFNFSSLIAQTLTFISLMMPFKSTAIGMGNSKTATN